MIAPKDESSNLVLQWLDTEGLSSRATVSSRGDSIVVQTSVSQVEKLLKAEYHVFGELSRFSFCLFASQFLIT